MSKENKRNNPDRTSKKKNQHELGHKVKCDNCGQYFNVTVHITYYGSKIK